MLTNNLNVPLILAVEDDRNHAELIQRSFEDAAEEYRLEFVATIRDAGMAIERCRPDLVLTDYQLPDGYGSELIEIVAGSCPVIVMTSHGSEKLAVEAMKIGAQDYIVKSPEAFESLPHTVSHALQVWSLIQSRRQAYQAVMQAKTDWERTFDAVPDLISIIDLNHTITRANKAMADSCGLTVEKIIGRKCHEVMHGITSPHANCPHEMMMQDGVGHSVQVAEKCMNGVFDISVSPLHDNEGQLIGCVHVAKDITESKRVEDRLKESEEKHRKLAHEQQIILNCSSVGISLLKNRKVQWANPTFDKIFGYETGATIGIDTVEFYSEIESYNAIGEKAYSTIASGAAFSQDAMMKKKDGSLIWCNLVGQAVNANKPEEGSIWVLIDITERRRNEEEKLNLENQLQQTQKMESIGRLAGGVAHDFNNMLGVIIGHASLALMETDQTHPLFANLEEIRKAAERSADLTRQLLAFARKQTIVPKVLDLNETVSGMFKMLQRLIGEHIQLVWQPAANLWPVKVDPSQIDQILANLCVNSRDSISDIGKISIETGNRIIDENYICHHSEAIPGEYVSLSVSDDGCGMDRETMLHIFEPFFTTKGVGEGTGLGLSTVFGAVKQNNGFINVYSEPGIGTTLTIYIPRYAGKAEHVQIEGTAEKDLCGQETILLVEDEPAILNMATLLLTKQGYSVIQANSAKEALRLAKERAGEIHLLMTDVVMPDMNGRDLAKSLQTFCPLLKCLFMSGYTADVIAQHGVLDEGVHFIQKPFSLPDLKAKVREVLDGN